MSLLTYKNIRVKKRGGGTRLQRVKVLKSGKYKFVKNIGGRIRKKVRRRSNPKTRRVRKTARKRRRRRYGMTIPLAPILGLFAGLAEPIGKAMAGDYERAINYAVRNYTGYNPYDKRWNPAYLTKGLLPLIVGAMVHKFVGGTLGINRMLGQAKVPVIRI